MAALADHVEQLTPSPWDVVGQGRSLSGPEDEFLREDILDDVSKATACAVRDGQVIARTPRGACVIRKEAIGGWPVVVFDHVELIETGPFGRRTFWMNASSAAPIGERLRGLPRRHWADIVREVVLP